MDQSLRSKLMNEVLDIDGNKKPKLSSPPLRSISPSEATALSSALDPSELQKLSVFVTNLKKTFLSKASASKSVATEWLKPDSFEKNVAYLCSIE